MICSCGSPELSNRLIPRGLKFEGMSSLIILRVNGGVTNILSISGRLPRSFYWSSSAILGSIPFAHPSERVAFVRERLVPLLWDPPAIGVRYVLPPSDSLTGREAFLRILFLAAHLEP